MRAVPADIAHERVMMAHSPLIRPCGATFSLRAKSRLRRLRSDTRLRAQPPRGKALGRMHGLGVDLIHPVIAVVLVEIDLDAVGRRYAVQAVIVPHKRGGADGNVRRHKDAQCPGQHSAAAGRQLLDAGGDRREQHLEPGNRRKAQKKQYSRLMRPPRLNGIAL